MVSFELVKEPRVRKSISLRPDQLEAAIEIAQEERHGNVSLIFQRLLDAEVSRRKAEAESSQNVEAA